MSPATPAGAYLPQMAYDYEAESRKLIAEGLPSRPVGLSRRHRFAPLAVDVDGNLAATRFLRRGVSSYSDDTHLLVRGADGLWRVLGGGGGETGEPWSTDAFLAARVALAPDELEIEGGAGVSHGSSWVSSAQILAGREVASIRVGARELVVPAHGRLVVVWSAPDPPVVTANDAEGRELTTVVLTST